MEYVAKGASTLIGALFLCVALAVVPAVKGVGTSDAHAIVDIFANGVINNGDRAIGNYVYAYGVGWNKEYDIGGVTDDVCIGAKTRSDGTGGNAIPFLCLGVSVGQTRWTPGGQSNYGYPTAIANADPAGYIFGVAYANRR
jgi:hypothetical protein